MIDKLYGTCICISVNALQSSRYLLGVEFTKFAC